MGFTDFEGQLVFYGQYHHNEVNIAIHFVCVPIILWTIMVFLSYLPIPSLYHSINLHLAFVLATIYTAYYVLLDQFAGSIYGILLFLMAYSAVIYARTFTTNGLSVAIVLHIFSWIMQVVAHGLYEGRAPALTENLVQSIALAPFFVFLEFLFWLGYRPSLQKRVNDRIVEALKEREQMKTTNRH